MPPDLSSLRSVVGVDVAFLFNNAGMFLSRDPPDLYTDQFLLSLQNSIQLAFNTADQYIGIYDDLLFCYQERIIYILRFESFMLCVIAMLTTNIGGLRTGTNLLISQTRLVHWTRSRAYKKNDQAHVEQKNFTYLRQLLGYSRYDDIRLSGPPHFGTNQGLYETTV
jgi:hypothetical protein